MARLESIAVGGYYPTPESVVPKLAALLDHNGNVAALDPCAGEGAALLSLLTALDAEYVDFTAIELEKGRHEALVAAAQKQHGWQAGQQALCGDAFRVAFRGRGCSLLYLNPPYDVDPEHGRLEEKFLGRFTAALAPGGVLIFLVPFYALKASAETLATAYEDVACYRFPEDEFSTYKQVALFARKLETPLWDPDPAVLADVLRWAADASDMPSLDEAPAGSYTLPAITGYHRSFGDEWTVRDLDFVGLLNAVEPWMQTDRGGRQVAVPGIVPDGALDDLLVRRYPLAMPPRPAHIAAGIAAGVFNGAKIGPDDPASPLPELLVKGVFDKEFRTVEEKKDKEGNTKAVVQIQQPRLVTTVLDLSTSKYTTIQPSGDLTEAATVEGMTMADLLARYGQGLMRVMLQQCPVMHEPSSPEHEVELASLARPLFKAQAHAVMATVKLLGGRDASRAARKYKSAFVLGEIGSGKTSVAISAAQSIGAWRTLVMCPPHLLQSWKDQVDAVAPWAKTVVLSDVTDVQRLADDTDPFPVIAILSRETAKLGHAYAAVERCGDCGTPVPPEVDHAKKRSRCEAQRIVPRGPFGTLVRDWSVAMARVFPGDARIVPLLRGSVLRAMGRWGADKLGDKARYEAREWARMVDGCTYDRLIDRLAAAGETTALELLVWADPTPARVLRVARALYAAVSDEERKGYNTPDVVTAARRLLLALPQVDAEEFKALDGQEWSRYDWANLRDSLHAGAASTWNPYGVSCDKEGKILLGKHALGDRRVALDALALLANASLRLANASLRLSKPCGAPLYQAVPEPRRFPLATFISKRHPELFDLLILDEGHEYATDGSAQERSAHRLTSLGLPTLLLTGSIMNGYAESMFTNMWAISPDFRREFSREDGQRFVDRYGYRKRLVEDKDKDSGKVVEYGSMSDRVERSERMIGNAPGVLPVFLLRYLLPLSVTLHKADLAIDIPRCTEVTRTVVPEDKLAANFRALQAALLRQITSDRFKEGLAGKLFGALAELPSYLDCATDDVGNTDSGRYEIRYPESAGGTLVAAADPIPASTLLPKERWLLEHLGEAFSSGRRVLIFAWHTRLLARIARLVKEHTGEVCPILDSSKVPTAKRQTWIDKEVIAKKRRVLVCNPVTVQTGLNNLVYFADEAWLENPGCNPVIYRQAVGRVDRIGQRLPTTIVFPLYEGTLQVALHSLLMQKVGVSMSTDGLDGESAMAAAGIGDTGFSTFSVGRQLYEMLTKSRAA